MGWQSCWPRFGSQRDWPDSQSRIMLSMEQSEWVQARLWTLLSRLWFIRCGAQKVAEWAHPMKLSWRISRKHTSLSMLFVKSKNVHHKNINTFSSKKWGKMILIKIETMCRQFFLTQNDLFFNFCWGWTASPAVSKAVTTVRLTSASWSARSGNKASTYMSEILSTGITNGRLE